MVGGWQLKPNLCLVKILKGQFAVGNLSDFSLLLAIFIQSPPTIPLFQVVGACLMKALWVLGGNNDKSKQICDIKDEKAMPIKGLPFFFTLVTISSPTFCVFTLIEDNLMPAAA